MTDFPNGAKPAPSSRQLSSINQRRTRLQSFGEATTSTLWKLRYVMSNPKHLPRLNVSAPFTKIGQIIGNSGMVHWPIVMIASALTAIAALSAVIPLLVSLIFMALPQEAQQGLFIGLAVIAGLFGIAAALLPLLFLVLAIYYTRKGLWSQLFSWWMQRCAFVADSLSSVTSNMRVLRAVFNEEDNQNGFFLTMATPQRFPYAPSRPILFDDDRHVMMLAGSRAGKGRAFIIPNLTFWAGSTIVFDPAGENFRETAKYRREVLGQDIVLLDPFGVTGEDTVFWNPLSEIDFENDPQAMDKCYLLAEGLIESNSKDPYWEQSARKVIAMLIAYVGTSLVEEQVNLVSVRDLLLKGELSELWGLLERCDAFDGLIRRFAESASSRAENEINSTMEMARTAMKWLDSPQVSNFVRRSSFSMKDLKTGNTSIYIVMPAGMGDVYKAWTRILFDAAFDAMQDLSIAKPENSTLFVLDEFPLMGRMNRIKRAAGEAAKFGVKLFVIAQDVTQLSELYGDSWETFVANSGALIMFANNDLQTQRYLSQRLGKENYYSHSYSKGTNASNSYSETVRDVARPDQAEKLVSRQSGEAFVFISGRKPMRIPRANYDEWDMTRIPSPPE